MHVDSAAVGSLDGGWLCDIPVTAPSGELLRIALTLRDTKRTVRDVKQLLLDQFAARHADLPSTAVWLVEQAAHAKLGLPGSRPTGDVVDRELHDAMSVDELRQRTTQGALLRLHMRPPHTWFSEDGRESQSGAVVNFALQPPSCGRCYVCISKTGKANVRPTASLCGPVVREIHPGDAVRVFEEKMYDGHLRGRISSHSDEGSAKTEWLSIRTRYGDPLLQAASSQEQADALELVDGRTAELRAHGSREAATDADELDPEEFELQFDNESIFG